MTLTGKSDVLGKILSGARRINEHCHVLAVMQDLNSRCGEKYVQINSGTVTDTIRPK